MQVKAIISKIVLIVHVVLPSIASLCELDDVPLLYICGKKPLHSFQFPSIKFFGFSNLTIYSNLLQLDTQKYKELSLLLLASKNFSILSSKSVHLTKALHSH